MASLINASIYLSRAKKRTSEILLPRGLIPPKMRSTPAHKFDQLRDGTQVEGGELADLGYSARWEV